MLTRPDGKGEFITLLGPVSEAVSLHSEMWTTGRKARPIEEIFSGHFEEPPPAATPVQVEIRPETTLHQTEAAHMIINSTSLSTLYTGFSTAFQSGFSGVDPLYKQVAMTVPSSTRSNEYGWLGQFPRIREWIGDRIIQNLLTQGYTIKNRSFESTIGVNRDDIQDDNVGIYTPMLSELGRLSATFPDELVWNLLLQGWATNCFDGQLFFDVDHPVLDADGTAHSVANTDGGNGPAWFLMDNTRTIRPIIYQERQPFKLVQMDGETDEAVFNRKEYRYGTDGRCNVGYGFWQLIWGSRQALDAAHYEAARTALLRMKGDYGRPLGVQPKLLVVGPSLEAAARRILNSENTGKIVTMPDNNSVAYPETNPWKGTADLLVVPWLA